jgi:glycine C-acetyltransferase
MDHAAQQRLEAELESIREQGLYKSERIITTPQSAAIRTADGREVLNFCANNYLGLADHPDVIAAAKEALDTHGFGLASVRFICGTQDLHKHLEATIAKFFGTDDAILYTSCFDANGGLFETILNEEDAVISDALNHASIIDSIRLAKSITKCATAVYKHADLNDLREKLSGAKGAKRRIVWSDGVFSMEGSIAPLPDLLQICKEHDAVLVIDDSHATGVLGKTGRGTAEHFGVLGEVDVITSTLGKALGGAAGGFVAGSAALCDYLTQRSRPQLFSNALPPTVASSALASVEFIEQHPERVQQLRDNARHFRERIIEAGFKPLAGETPIIPIIVGETSAAIRMSDMLLDEGVFVTGFGYPVVPQGQARIRCQISAAHTRDDLDQAVRAFVKVGTKLGVV